MFPTYYWRLERMRLYFLLCICLFVVAVVVAIRHRIAKRAHLIDTVLK